MLGGLACAVDLGDGSQGCMNSSFEDGSGKRPEQPEASSAPGPPQISCHGVTSQSSLLNPMVNCRIFTWWSSRKSRGACQRPFPR